MLLLTALIVLLSSQLPLSQQTDLNPDYPPVGCPNYGLCYLNMYDTSYSYYKCLTGYCTCNTGTYYLYDSASYAADPNSIYCAGVVDQCVLNACPANSVCQTMINNYECECAAGYTGEFCNMTLSADPCLSSPCQNGGSCTDLGSGKFKCACDASYLGERCQYENTCVVNNPCLNGATCVMLFHGEQQYCKCASGYQGATCNIQTTKSSSTSIRRAFSVADVSMNCIKWSAKFASSNCTSTTSQDKPSRLSCRQNLQAEASAADPPVYYCTFGAKCTLCAYWGLDASDESSDSQCDSECSESDSSNRVNYAGANDTCGTNSRGQCYKYKDTIDALTCNSSVCLNGGVCVDLAGAAKTCLCPREYAGSTCATPVSPCTSSPCQNGGTCSNSTNGDFSYSCTCAVGYTGYTCTEHVYCDTGPCQFGSKCVELEDGYTCECLSQYTGTNCDIPNMCASSPCYQGNCSVDFASFDSTYACACDPGWTGPTCSATIDFCASGPCLHNSTCYNFYPPAWPFFNCTCLPGTDGYYCENNPDDCIYHFNGGKKYSTCNTTDPQGQCIDGYNSFTCQCGPDYTSADCSIPMIIYNATIVIFGEDAAVSDDIINMLKELLSNPANIKDMVPFILGLESDAERSGKSWDYDDMFAWIAYEEKTLNLQRDLVKWNDVTLGNCFTFNHRNNTDAQYRARSLYGLLKINSDEYCPWVDTQAIQVFVHPAEEDIFSESVRYNAEPGGETELIPTLTAYSRLGGRYGECVKSASEVAQYFYSGAYTTDGCLRSCYQKAVQEVCDCMDPRYPMPADSAACSLTQRQCVETVAEERGDPSTWEDCKCPLPCENRAYTLAWARTVYSSTRPQCSQSGVNSTSCTAQVYDSVRVSVALRDFTYQLYAEEPKMTLNQFIGNLGGLLGVLMGISMISFIETAFLFVAVFVTMSRTMSNKSSQ